MRYILPILMLMMMLLSACSRQPLYKAPTIKGNNAEIDISALRNEAPQFYTYRYQGKNISFFVIKLDDKVLSFFDACATCFPHKLGYRFEDAAVVCRACDMRFPVYKLEKGIGGCYPVKLEGRIEKEKYLIPIDAIKAEAAKF